MVLVSSTWRLLIVISMFGVAHVLPACGGELPVAVTNEPAQVGSREVRASGSESQVGPVSESGDSESSGAKGNDGPAKGDVPDGNSEPEPTPLEVPEGVSPALARDAQWYAEQYEVSLEEAINRLTLQETIGELNGVLEAKEKGTFVGLWIQHKPDYRVIVSFTRDGEETIRPYIEGSTLENIVEVRTAAATLRDLEQAQRKASKMVARLGFQISSDINVYENRVALYPADRAELEAALE